MNIEINRFQKKRQKKELDYLLLLGNFFGLTARKIEKGDKIKLYANLKGINGIEENAIKFIYESKESVNPEMGKSLQ